MHDHFDILDNQNSVIHHNTDRENQTKECEKIDRKTRNDEHSDKCADQGDGDGDHGDEVWSPGLQKEIDDENNEKYRLKKGVNDIVNRYLHIFCRIIRDSVIDAFREAGFDTLHYFADLFSNLKSITAG